MRLKTIATDMFFAPPYQYPPAGLYTPGHAALFATAAMLIALALALTRRASPATVRRIVRVCTGVLWGLEIAKIVFVLLVTGSRNPNDFIPLYYCSLVLYAGLFSSVGRGRLRRLGDVFLATGGMIGGACFLVCPNTSLPRYPVFHFISFHSFLLHGIMVFLGLLLLMRGLVRLRFSDLWYCAGLVSAMCLLAFLFNLIYSNATGTETANLMFMSRDFPGTPVHLLFVLTGKLFPAAMWLVQAFVPYLAVYGILQLMCKVKTKNRRKRSYTETAQPR